MAPSQINNITVERNSQNGLLYYSLKGNSHLLNVIQGDLFKIQDSDFNGFIISKASEIRFYEIKTNDGYRTFVLMPTVQAVGGRGGGGVKMGQVTQMINGTTNFIAKFTPDGHHVGDSLLFDSGTSIGFGTTTPNADATFDIQSTTQGFLVPRMTTLQRDAIPAPPDGLLVFNTTTELFSYWDATAGVWQNIDSQAGGDVSGSGITNFVTKWTDGANSVIGNSTIFDNGTNVGIGTITPNNKLQVAGAITTGVGSTTLGAIVFQNSTNNNTVAIASGVTAASYSVTLPTAQGGASTFLENDGAGNLSWGTVVLTNFYQNGGNAFGGNATIGLTDNFNWSFLTNNTVRGLIDNAGLWAIGSSSTTAGTRLAITSTGTTSATFAAQIFNATPASLMVVRDDGFVGMGTTTPSVNLDVVTMAGIGSIAMTADISAQLRLIGLSSTTFTLTTGYNGSFFEIWHGLPSTNSLVQLGTTGNMRIGLTTVAPLAGTKLEVDGIGNTSATYSFKVLNSTPIELFAVRDDGVIEMPALQTGNAGLATGQIYKDTAANILANGDYVVAYKA